MENTELTPPVADTEPINATFTLLDSLPDVFLRTSDAGVSVTQDTVLGIPAVKFCTSKIAGDIGKSPKRTVIVDDEEFRNPSPTAVEKLLNHRANPGMTGTQFAETLQQWALLWGNGAAFIERDARDEIVGLWPLEPDRVQYFITFDPKFPLSTRRKWIQYTPESGGQFFLAEHEFLHIPGLGTSEIGYSVIDLLRNSFGSAIAGEKHGNFVFANHAMPGIIIELPLNFGFGEDTEAERKKFLRNFQEFYRQEGTSRTGLVMGGSKVHSMGMPNKDSQWLESRQFSRVDIALIFGLETIPGDGAPSPYNSFGQKTTAYRIQTLQKWETKWTQELDEKLLTEAERSQGITFAFLSNIGLQMAPAELMDFCVKGRTANIFTGNDCLKLLGFPRSDDPMADTLANPNTTSGSGEQTGHEDEEDDDEISSHNTNLAATGPTPEQQLSMNTFVRQKAELTHAASKGGGWKGYLAKWIRSQPDNQFNDLWRGIDPADIENVEYPHGN